ncbi:MAG: PEGA domain-containing protein [Rhodothermales bacterium]|nr:PEGA domain-containing protein [Rhodothermales bacterium]
MSPPLRRFPAPPLAFRLRTALARWLSPAPLFGLLLVGAALVGAAALLFANPTPADTITAEELRLLARNAPAPNDPAAPTLRAERSPPAALTVETLPSGAEVWLNDELAGRTPLRLSSVEPGFYAVSVRQAGYAQLDTFLYLEPAAATVTTVALRSVLGEPTDTQALEPLPPFASAAPSAPSPRGQGATRARSRRSGGGGARLRRADAEAIRHAHTTGSLTVQSVPAGAEVWIDGHRRGRTPLNLRGLEAKVYGVTLVEPGKRRVTRNVEVTAGAVVVVEVKLGPAPSTELPTADPSTAHSPSRKRGRVGWGSGGG